MSFIFKLKASLINEKSVYDLSRNEEYSEFDFIGYRETALTIDFVALVNAQILTETEIVNLRNKFFDITQNIPHDFGLKPAGRNPNGLLVFVFENGLSDNLVSFIEKQSKISHSIKRGALVVSWSIGIQERKINTHNNPVSWFPPVIIAATTVFPGLDYLESFVNDYQTSESETSFVKIMDEMKEFDIALSFAGEDRTYVEKVAGCLKERGVKVFYDNYETANLWGKDLYSHLTSIYKDRAKYTLIFISKYYRDKLWTNLERKAAQARAFGENQEYILPARFDDTEIEGILPTVGFIDLRRLSPQEVCVLVCKKLGHDLFDQKTDKIPSPSNQDVKGESDSNTTNYEDMKSNSVANSFLQTRLDHLKDNINKDLKLLVEYEDLLRTEDDPKRKVRYQKEIETLKNSASKYTDEYNELEQKISSQGIITQTVGSELKDIQGKLDALLSGQSELNQNISETQKSILAHYTQSEQKILAGIAEKINQSQSQIINQLLEKIDKNEISSLEINNTFKDLQNAIVKAEKNVEISIPEKEGVMKVINDPQLNSKQRLKFIIPIIPFLLNYEQEIELLSGVNLQKVWDRLVGKFYK